MIWTFVPVAVLLSLTPGPATALVVRSAAAGATRAASRTIMGGSNGIGVWAVLSALGISALVAASETGTCRSRRPSPVRGGPSPAIASPAGRSR